jgi:hypothetical protein
VVFNHQEKKIGWDDGDSIHLAQNKQRWKAVVSTAMNHPVPRREFLD